MATTQTLPTALTNWYKSVNNTTVPKPSGLLAQAGAVQVNPATYNPTTLKNPTAWNVTKDQTAAGQLEDITRKDSGLMQLARTRGLQQANQRGLLNSSMGIGAAQDAVIAAAAPIAQADADVRSKAAGYNAETQNAFAKTNAQIENEAKNFGAQSINRANEFNASNEFNRRQQDDAQAFDKWRQESSQGFDRSMQDDAQAFEKWKQETGRSFDRSMQDDVQAFDKWRQENEQAYNKQQALFEANVKASLSQIENEAQFDRQAMSVYGGLGQEFGRAIMSINQDTNMDQQSKDFAIRQMFDSYKSQVSMLSAVGSIPDVGQLLIADTPSAPAGPAPIDPNANRPQIKTNFDAAAYLSKYPDLQKNAWARTHPWLHYQQYGKKEGRTFTYKAA